MINFVEKANKIHNNKYDYSLVEYINSKTKIKIICPIHGVFEQTPAKHLMGRGCQKCGGSEKLTKELFIQKAIEIHGDKYDYSDIIYINNLTKIKIFCKKCQEYFYQSPNGHITKKYGCPKCSGNKKLNKIEFVQRSEIIHNYKYDYSLVEYINAHTKVKIICPNHGIFEQSPNSHLQNVGCPKCNRSKGEEQIEKYLLEKNIQFINQYRFDNCKDKRKLPFDFYLPEHNACIEFDGKQHFKLENNFWGGEKTVKNTQKHDNIKNDYCMKNNIILFRINYKDDLFDKLNFIYNTIKINEI